MSAFLYSYTSNKNFFKFYGVPEERLFFHPCSVDNRFFSEEAKKFLPRKLKLRKKLKVQSPELPTVLYTGKFIQRKRIWDLLEAYKQLTTNNLKLKTNIFLVGDGPEREDLEMFVRKNGLRNVYFFGFKNQSKMPLFYAASDIFVLPSDLDPSPKSINEAMNFSLPIVTTKNVGTAPDLVLNGKTGFTYPVGDINSLRDSLEKLIGSQKLRESIGKAAFKLVSEWSFEEMMKGLRNALAYTKNRKQ